MERDDWSKNIIPLSVYTRVRKQARMVELALKPSVR